MTTTIDTSIPAPTISPAQLTSFSLKGQGLKLNTREDIAPLLAAVDQSAVEEICLSGNTVGVDAGKALGEWLSGCNKIRVVDLSDIFTGRLISEIPLALTSICDALTDKTSLREINLSDNAFGGRSVDPLVPLLSTNTSIATMKLNNNGLGPEGGRTVASALLSSALLSKAQNKSSNLRVVVCGRNRLENGSADRWAEAFGEHGGIEEIRMPQNGIRMDGVVALAKGLGKCGGLQVVDMQDNCFSDDGGKEGNDAWASALRGWTSLRELNLSDCVLSSEGEVPKILEELGEGSNPGLAKLWLQNDNLAVDAFEVLAGAIEGGVMGGLRMLDLMDNDVDVEEEGEEVVGRLRRAMKGRKGRFLATDEDEDAEEEEEEEEEEEKVEEKVEAKVEEKLEEKKEEKKESTSIGDKLADLMKKVTLSS